MKQVLFAYENSRQLNAKLGEIGRLRGDLPLKLLFQIYTEQNNFNQLTEVCNTVVSVFPDALCIGSSCNGSFVGGAFSGKSVTVSCTIFEQPSSRIGILQYPLDQDQARARADDLVREVEKRPWITAVQLLAASPAMSYTDFCKGLSALRREVQVFGGVAGRINDEIPSYVFSNRHGFSESAVICILYGGENLHVETTSVSGWKPLGRNFTVTKANKNILWELDNQPAFETYSKYLNIQNDYYFSQNTLEFPLFYYGSGDNIFRCPIACSEEGALMLAADIPMGTFVRISYGDPQSIMDSVRIGAGRLSKFCPDAIFLYASVARKSFWGEKDVNKETLPFNTIASTSGAVTACEFLRTNGIVNLHNSVMALVAMREGPADFSKQKVAVFADSLSDGKVSVISRLANFTNVSSAELMEMYNKMTKNSITDGLTDLYNRAEIQRRIEERFAEFPAEKMSLVMIDIDNFKSVNDTFGHKEGDNVIMGLSKQIQMASFENAPDADAGRWGGEEFMIMLPDMGAKEAVAFAEAVRTGFSKLEFELVGKKTISLGVTELRKGDTSDSICVRVDDALYKAKKTGKNKVVVL
ncbi:MAG: diguanylate cyclase [Fibrobacter sp.]|nr:diguanylate cyclase [Fibrobacter sp.]